MKMDVTINFLQLSTSSNFSLRYVCIDCNQDDLGSSYTIEGNLSNILFHTHTESGLLITSDAKIVLL